MTDKVNTNEDNADLAGAADEALANGGENNGQDTAATADKTDAATVDAAKARPDYIDEQFWDKEKGELKVEALAKSWKDLRQKISQGVKEPPPPVPDKYEFTAAENVKVEANDPVLSLAKQAAHKAGLSNAQLNAFINTIHPMLEQLTAERTREPTKEEVDKANNAELTKLHKDPAQAQKIVNNVVSFFKNKVDQGVLEPQDYRALMRMGGDAEGISALRKVISVVWQEHSIPGPDASIEVDGYSKDQFYKDVASKEYQSDPEFRSKVRRKAEKLLANA